MLRTSALKIIRALGIEGGCNVQYALDPRLHRTTASSRSTRASAAPRRWRRRRPATRSPAIAAKIAIGRRLDEIDQRRHRQDHGRFEPALDYCVVKIPRWPFDKFAHADRTITTQMKATGEVMAIDRSFEGALQKAVRSLETDRQGPGLGRSRTGRDGQLVDARHAGQTTSAFGRWRRALRRGVTARRCTSAATSISGSCGKLEDIVAMERRLAAEPLDAELLWAAKRAGFSDAQIGKLSGQSEASVASIAP